MSGLSARAGIYRTASNKYLRGPCPPETGGGIIGGGRGNRGIPIIGGSGLGPYADMGGRGGGWPGRWGEPSLASRSSGLEGCKRKGKVLTMFKLGRTLPGQRQNRVQYNIKRCTRTNPRYLLCKS